MLGRGRLRFKRIENIDGVVFTHIGHQLGAIKWKGTVWMAVLFSMGSTRVTSVRSATNVPAPADGVQARGESYTAILWFGIGWGVGDEDRFDANVDDALHEDVLRGRGEGIEYSH